MAVLHGRLACFTVGFAREVCMVHRRFCTGIRTVLHGRYALFTGGFAREVCFVYWRFYTVAHVPVAHHSVRKFLVACLSRAIRCYGPTRQSSDTKPLPYILFGIGLSAVTFVACNCSYAEIGRSFHETVPSNPYAHRIFPAIVSRTFIKSSHETGWITSVHLQRASGSDRLVGLVVKASASRAEDPGFESRLRRDFFGVESYQ